MVFLGGILVDKVGSRSVWSIATFAIGISGGMSVLIILRLIVGMAEGPTGPSLMGCVSNWLPAPERARALALIIAANPFSSLSFISAILGHDLWIILTSLSLAIGFGLGPSSCFYALNDDLTDGKSATSAGIMVACLAFAGVIAPIITVYLTNLSGNFSGAIFVMLALIIAALTFAMILG